MARRETAILVVAVVMFVYFWVSTPNFVGYNNLVTLSQFVAPIAVIGFGEVMLLTLGEIDLSSGTIFVAMPFLAERLAAHGLPLLLAIVLTVIAGGAVGAINGLITILLGLPSFITTLGTLFAIDGVLLLATNATEAGMPHGATVGTVFGIYSWSEILWALGLCVVMYIILHRSRIGLHVVATGGNRNGAAEAGVPVRRVVLWAFVMSGLLASLIGVIDAIRVGTIDPGNTGTTEMFYAVAAAIIGGTAMTGGRGTQIGAAIGAIVLGILYVGFTLRGINANAFILILGIAILVAMAVNVQLGRVSQRRGGRKKAT